MKKFILACAAVLCLLAMVGLDSKFASGQSPSGMRYIGVWESNPVVFSGSDLYVAWSDGWTTFQSRVPALPVSPSEVLCVQGDANGGKLVTIWGALYYSEPHRPWALVGTIPGATPVSPRAGVTSRRAIAEAAPARVRLRSGPRSSFAKPLPANSLYRTSRILLA